MVLSGVFLDWFTGQGESPLEQKESCDSNRIYDNGYTQLAVIMPYRPYFSVDSPGDIEKVEQVMVDDCFYEKY